MSCFTGKIEMGQGVVTSLAQILAEELDVPLTSVDMVMGDTDLCPWDMGTFGSRSTRFFGPPLREAAAEARKVLIQLAAERLGVDKARLVVRDGVVRDRENSAKQVTYGQLAQGKIIERRPTAKPVPKPVSQYTIVGKASTRKDGAAKVTGGAAYAGDVRLPDMLHARMVIRPAHGAKLKSVDTSALQGDKEVKLVRDGDLIAVLHRYPDGAEEALSRIKAEWDVPQSDLDAKPSTRTFSEWRRPEKWSPKGETSRRAKGWHGRRTTRRTATTTWPMPPLKRTRPLRSPKGTG